MSSHLLDNEHDPILLRELAKMQNEQIIYLKGLLKAANEEKQKKLQQSLNLEDSLLILRKKLFGKSSEKLNLGLNTQDLNVFDRLRSLDEKELTLHCHNMVPPRSVQTSRRMDEEVILSELTDDELKSASIEYGLLNPSSDQWEKISGFFEESQVIDVIERKFVKKVIRRQKYKLKKSYNEGEKEDVIITANHPGPRIAPGCSYSIDFSVMTILDKYLYHLPLERQTRQMRSLGLNKTSTQVLYNLSRLTALHLEDVSERIKKEVLKQSLVHADETPWPINNKKDSDGYMWIISNQAGSYYRFEPSRSGKVIKELLKEYQGYLMNDGYSGYTQFKNKDLKIKSVMCHAHARRYFKDILEVEPQVMEYLNYYKELSLIERQAKDFEELKYLRQEKSKPIIEKMRHWLEEKYPGTRSQSAFRKAIQYSFNHWAELIKFLDDPVIPLTNNEAERTIRQAVMGRKNFYGSRSIDGADLTATMYTIIESCKKFELDPRRYLLDTVKASASNQKTMTPYEYALKLNQ